MTVGLSFTASAAVPARSALLAAGPPLFFFPDSAKANVYNAQGRGWRASFTVDRVTFHWADQQLAVQLVGRDPHLHLFADTPTGTVNLLQSSDRTHWRPGLPLSQGLTYKGLYRGIDLTYRGSGAHLKSEFTIAPGADPGLIAFSYDGISNPAIDASGALVLSGPGGNFREEPPLVYQDSPHGPTLVPARYRLIDAHTVGFQLGEFDLQRAIIIDPDVTFSTLWGGNSFDALTGIAVGPDGSLFVCGWTESADVPVASGFQTHVRGSVDAFVMKLSPAADAIRYATYLGGSSFDQANGIAVDTTGSAYVTGFTSSTDFPVANAFQATNHGGQDAFLTKLSLDGTTLLYSTYLGGEASDAGNAVAVDTAGSAYVTGYTRSVGFPYKAGVQAQLLGLSDAFVTKFTAAGTALAYSTYIGGSGTDQALGIALKNTEVFIVGATDSTNFPTVSAYQSANGGAQDGFVVHLAATGGSLVYSTYLGGNSGYPGYPEYASAIAVNGAGEAFVAGVTSSSNFPVLTPYQTSLSGMTDAFVTKLTASGTALGFSTYLGGSSSDMANGIALDGAGNIYVTGTTYSWDFPMVQAVQTSSPGLPDAFVASLPPTGNALRFSTYWGGSGSEDGSAIAIDATGNPVFAGRTLSYNFPLKAPLQSTNGSGYGGYLTKLNLAPTALHSAAGIFRAGLWLTDNNADGFFTGPPTDMLMWLGQGGDTPLVGDWNGSGHSKTGTFRGGLWVTDYNGNFQWDNAPPDFVGSLGQTGDIPVLGDWTGNGKTKFGIFRNGLWLLDGNGNGLWDGTGSGDLLYFFGQAGDVPVVGDWNGSGKTKVGVFRNGLWLLDANGNGAWDGTTLDKLIGLGQTGDVPVVGDWNGSGTTKVGIFRSGLWQLDYNGNGVWDGTTGTNADRICSLGQAGDTAVIGDWNGDGHAKIGVFRSGFWILDYNGNGQWDGPPTDRFASLGQAGDLPIVGKW